MPIGLKLLVAGFLALCCLIACAAGCGQPPVAEREPGVFDFEPDRAISDGLMFLARKRAEENATAGTPQMHTDLSKHVRGYGVMAENVGTATSWDFMYHRWRNSYEHNNNINAKNLHYYGFCVCESPGTKQKCFVVIYSSRNPW